MTSFAAMRAAAATTSESLRRRARLAREPHPPGVPKPPLKLLLEELAAIVSRGRMSREVPVAPAQTAMPVMLLPGFGAHPARMRPMASCLESAGHKVYEWGLGFNLGPTPANFAFLLARVRSIARTCGEPVALVGWSLGGLYAREIAKLAPADVARVITMGTPFSGDPRANNGWRAYQVITGHSVDRPPVGSTDLAQKPPVPTTALWSPRDGVIAPRSACGWPGERDRAIALRCNHLGFASSPEAVMAVLRELDCAIDSHP
ncbi:MAG TPA: alpha/beta hydrolase [Novosphingobium sp.]|nr:alpha/beta hydrolase [Novosphingobium sp.]